MEKTESNNWVGSSRGALSGKKQKSSNLKYISSNLSKQYEILK
jgi:hypothetical protein